MRFINDRLSQLARIAGAQVQPEQTDNLLSVGRALAPVVELVDPIRAGGSAPFGSAAAPFAESLVFHDVLDMSGVVGLDTRTLVTFAPGCWHLNIHKTFTFDGTTNFGKSHVLNLTTVAADLGTVIFTAQLFGYRFQTGARRDVVRDLALTFLTPWQLVTITTGTVAADELHAVLSVNARRFI